VGEYSHDSFKMFRAWIILQGNEVTQHTIDNPSSLIKAIQNNVFFVSEELPHIALNCLEELNPSYSKPWDTHLEVEGESKWMAVNNADSIKSEFKAISEVLEQKK
jgi:hypothetical protein